MTENLFPSNKTENKPVTVLGRTFSSEDERRTYFREELRKKLPELKKMEGFPIGEDDDIINLSDPPYYTACPNPWLNDFIAQWEEVKMELEKQGLRTADFEVTEPYAADVSEGKNNPIYNAHTYHTKVPHPAIMRYILHYTQPGDIVFDGFAGTGMTGVAASMCGNPDIDFKYSIEKDHPDVKWGERNAICSDLSTVATFISSNYNSKIDSESFAQKATKLLIDCEKELGWMFETLHSDGKTKGKVKYYVWSDVYQCPNCLSEVVFYEAAVDSVTGKVDDQIQCPNCSHRAQKRKYLKLFESYYDELIKQPQQEIKRKLVLINYWVGKKIYTKKPDDYDYKILDRINLGDLSGVRTNLIPPGDKTSEPIRLGIKYSHQMFFKKVLYMLSWLYSKADDNHLKLLINSQITNLSKQNRYRPGVSFPFNPLNGTLYIGAQVSEANPLWALNNKVKKFEAAFFMTEQNVTSLNDASQTNIESNSIDYIFTDPPFGLNLMYSELNFFMETWLGIITNNKKEAIENKTQKKNQLEYARLMEGCFNEFYRILKPGKWMTVEFSNTSAAIWNGIQVSLQNSGFIISNLSGLDKKQGSFNSVTNATSVKQDLIITCYKPSSEFDQKFNEHKHTNIGVWDFIEEHLEHLPVHINSGDSTTAIIERSPKILFDRLISFYVQRSLPVPLDAGKFQQGLKERFIERDGMFFTHEQASEYERKKADVPNFIQLSIFVGNEQDAIFWLRNILDKAPKTEQDLHPLWMKEVAANMRKGDNLPEMRTILEENFLKDDAGKWYVPDAENEADLEKLRNRRLMKIFEEYRAEAAKPKGKLKEVRVEALRAGFKQCYQDKDFTTIVTVGDRIPNNLLMEDEVLLQFYDIATSRI